MISSVPLKYLSTVWPMVEPLLQRAIDKNPGLYTTNMLYRDLITGAQTLWVSPGEHVIDMAFTTRVVQFETGRMLVIEWLGGDNMEDWLESGLETIEAYANDLGCMRMEVYGRKGWKVLEKYGWKDAAVIYRKELET